MVNFQLELHICIYFHIQINFLEDLQKKPIIERAMMLNFIFKLFGNLASIAPIAIDTKGINAK